MLLISQTQKSSIIVDKVLEENEDFRNFYENQSFIPKKKSMLRSMQRARQNIKPPTVSSPDFELEKLNCI